ncbi:MAG TPA: lysozyme [Chitinophagaceae bacterium]|jgi:lysozyme|nr:lysozyme [Chitinophagaceae bacterium]
MVPDNTCFEFIKSKEGLELKAYQDSAGIWTIGYGTIIYEDQTPVKKGDVITQERADELIEREISSKSAKVNAAVANVPVNQNQFNALVSFAYNVGTGALLSSTLLKRVKADPSDPNIRDAFMMWNKAHVNGKLVAVKGLTNRRAAEANLYFS